jgi:hypothetical protein
VRIKNEQNPNKSNSLLHLIRVCKQAKFRSNILPVGEGESVFSTLCSLWRLLIVRTSPTQISASGATCLAEALAVNATLVEYEGPGGPLLPIAQRRANRQRWTAETPH